MPSAVFLISRGALQPSGAPADRDCPATDATSDCPFRQRGELSRPVCPANRRQGNIHEAIFVETQFEAETQRNRTKLR
jgi:hypothetical protein